MLDFITWNADPFLFHIGNFGLRWYSLAFMVGFLAVSYTHLRAHET